MSGGYFDYQQNGILDIIDRIARLIKTNKKKGEYGYARNYSVRTIFEFRKGIEYLTKAYIYAKRIDWLVSGDDGEDTFHEELKEELKQ
jgi:hypothetical protein